eukprot:2482828-Amphidinium_carterae.3
MVYEGGIVRAVIKHGLLIRVHMLRGLLEELLVEHRDLLRQLSEGLPLKVWVVVKGPPVPMPPHVIDTPSRVLSIPCAS